MLRGYKQEGKRFIPPVLQRMSFTETSWMDDRVPELVWIALLIHIFGLKDGTAVATGIASAAARCAPTANKAFGAASDYMELSDNQKQCVCLALSAENALEKAVSGLAALIDHYPDFPLAFLANPSAAAEDSSGSTLADLKEAIENIIDRESYAGTLTQAVVVCIYFTNDKLKVAPGMALANFPIIEEYPATAESQRVGASVRAAVSAMFTQNSPSSWGRSFWNRGRLLDSCEIT